MILLLLLNALYSLFSILTTAINIPSMPEAVTEFSLSIADYIGMGIGILSVYTDLGYLITLFGIIFTIDVGVMMYKFVMWVIRKIPIANIS